MKKNSKNSYKDIDDFFAAPPNINQKAWSLINEFYHMILTHMENNNISKADLARKLGKSRAAISQMFNKTPNISVKKMVEIAEAVGVNIHISSDMITTETYNMDRFPIRIKLHYFIEDTVKMNNEIHIKRSEKSNKYPTSTETSISANVSEKYRDYSYH